MRIDDEDEDDDASIEVTVVVADGAFKRSHQLMLMILMMLMMGSRKVCVSRFTSTSSLFLISSIFISLLSFLGSCGNLSWWWWCCYKNRFFCIILIIVMSNGLDRKTWDDGGLHASLHFLDGEKHDFLDHHTTTSLCSFPLIPFSSSCIFFPNFIIVMSHEHQQLSPPPTFLNFIIITK